MNLYYVLIKSHGIYVKEGEFFKSQGGLKDQWGKNWKPIYADSIEHARLKGKLLLNNIKEHEL